MKVPILNIHLDNLTHPQLLQKIEEFLNSNKQRYIVTPNPEFLVAAKKDQEFANILNQADLAIPDGFGLKIASRILHNQKLHRHTGVDAMLKICALASKLNKSIYLFGAGEGIAQEAANQLKKQFPNLKISGAESGGKINLSPAPYRSELSTEAKRAKVEATGSGSSILHSRNENSLSQNKNIDIIKKANPDILFVALGQIKQEKWLAKNLEKLPSVRLAMGVGGSFDYISKKTPRAPKFLRALGLEWLFRLITQPKRAGRIWNAVMVFMWLVFKEKLTK